MKLDNEKLNKTLESLNIEEKDFYYTNLKYNEGIIANLDLLQKREALWVTKKTAVSGRTDCIIDQIGLYKAVAAQDI